MATAHFVGLAVISFLATVKLRRLAVIVFLATALTFVGLAVMVVVETVLLLVPLSYSDVATICKIMDWEQSGL